MRRVNYIRKVFQSSEGGGQCSGEARANSRVRALRLEFQGSQVASRLEEAELPSLAQHISLDSQQIKEAVRASELPAVKPSKAKRRKHQTKRTRRKQIAQSLGARARKRADETRINSLLDASACTCSCGACFKPLRACRQELCLLMRAFSVLPERKQTRVIAQQCPRDGRQVYFRFWVLGHEMDKACFCRITMLSPKRLHKILVGGPTVDQRSMRLVRRRSKSRSVRHWLLELYCRAGETLPNWYYGKRARRNRSKMHRHHLAARRIPEASSASGCSEELKEGPADDFEVKSELMADKSLWAKYVQGNRGLNDAAELPKRFLPPGTIWSLFQEYGCENRFREQRDFKAIREICSDIQMHVCYESYVLAF